ncbi:arylamine N-acetyltransferase family protein [Bacillus sp. JJ1764]|uniref:arylamine N-acetyltransferase family protein n=1 Tax=Bacillus sp. JJ1764 TaxID=3122964 RepID=UPI0030004AAA
MQINKQFRSRIGFPTDETITFETLPVILEKTALAIPFENLSIIRNEIHPLTLNNVAEKILIRNQGGLCYELNTILYQFLMENGFEVTLVLGSTYNAERLTWSPTGRTHVINILTYKGNKYAVDTGFGGNLPLVPVPLTGECVSSRNGEFRIKEERTEYGNYVLEMKLRHKHQDWVTGYTLDTTRPVKDLNELSRVQQIIVESDQSPFNKNYLVTRITEKGNMILTDSSFTNRIDGKELKENIQANQFELFLKSYFNIVK